MKKILEKVLEKVSRKWYDIKAKRELFKRRKLDYSVELINEKWLIKRINDGQVARRKELKECQDRIKEIVMFIEFLKSN